MESGKSVLVVGSGLMTPPLIRNLKSFGLKVTVLGNIPEDLERLASNFSVETHLVDVGATESLKEVAQQHDLVISMVPPPLHPQVLRACIAARKNMVTSSYISPELRSLEEEAKTAGVAVLNEMGLDPGIDNMTIALKVQEIKNKGGKIKKLVSTCGAIPAPQNPGPLGYKISWAPSGALLAFKRPAKFYEEGELKVIEGNELMKNAREYQFGEDLEKKLVFYPNGDSTSYHQTYGLEEVPTLIRASFRYRETSVIFRAFILLGLFEQSLFQVEQYGTWKSLVSYLAGEVPGDPSSVPSDLNYDPDLALRLSGKFSSEFTSEQIQMILKALGEAGFLSDSPIQQSMSIFDAFVEHLKQHCSYAEGEKDMVYMENLFWAEEGGEEVLYRSKMKSFGEPRTASAVSELVGLPASLGAKWILTHKLSSGFHVPSEIQIAADVLKELQNYGVTFEESVQKLSA
mmetsp:Transcript_9403/g.14001  ORF Transcript_9403/g.14001 Transcript_9403/m.14001 type:complete len:459 (+) Transcript_9403:6-1382(+)|eukprot:CAMPEP_0202440428 /NCGR_PEP_ID=MMETSP1345-20130828/36689_1 /ASSEMBLY_ACC=CAM_ASM_000843 /TAXON_ID=342563 /ORGANISM="Fabrea Fabrea salina" /LENGTH=458 /DNA_ID=CAMNT_0049055021 /DNA_START=593 /DNA_END=1969 /DNA_ORIENTATION=-